MARRYATGSNRSMNDPLITAPTKTFDIDCTLSYTVTGPTDFLFQIHALRGMDQQVLS